MGLFSFLQRKKPAPETRKRTPPPQDPVTVEALRTRARRRLIGAAVLVGGAVVGLPTLFDKPPRPVDQAFNVRLTAADGTATVSVRAPTAAGSASAPRPLASTSASASAPSVSPGTAATVAAAAATAGTAAAVAGVLPSTGKKPPADEAIITEPKPDPKAEAAKRAVREQAQADKLRVEKAKAEKLKADKAREADKEKAREAEQAREAEKARQIRLAKKAKEAKDAKEAQDARDAADAKREAAAARKAKEAKAAKEAKVIKEAKAALKDDADKSRRYVIQAGSFSEASAARDLGRRIDKLGLDSHEQHVETASGHARTRVRLGPFNSKEEAQRAAARLKAAGLNAAVLPL